MNKDTVLQSVRDYIQDDKAKYAIMLSGRWGTGKTYLYEHGIADVIRNLEYGKDKKKRKAEVYISLYGVSTVEELTKEIVVNYFLKCKLNENATGKKAFKGVSKIVGIVSKMLSFSINNVSVSIDKIPEIFHENTDFKDMVICFDDLERCSIPINNLFGLINNLVEHCNCKVIIIADEDNIGKMYANTNIEEKYLAIMSGRRLELKIADKDATQNTMECFQKISLDELKKLNEKIYSENFIYRDVKEKVIGLTLKYELQLDEEYSTIVSDSASMEKYKEYLTRHKEAVLMCMEQCDNQNIRILKNWIINFERIYEVVDKHCQNDKKYFERIMQKLMIYSVRVACAVGKNIKLQTWKYNEQISGNADINDSVFSEGYRFIDTLFLESFLDDESVCYVINYLLKECKVEEEQTKKKSIGKSFEKLQEWRYLEDEDIEQTIELLIQEIREKKYAYQQYQRILASLVFLQSIDLFKGQLADVTDIMVNNISTEKDEIDVDDLRIDFNNKEQEAVFYKHYNPVYNAIMEKNREIKQVKSHFILSNSDDDWAEEFKTYCKDNEEKFRENSQFIEYIDLDYLLEKIKTARAKEVYCVDEGFRIVYRFGNIKQIYRNEVPQLEQFVKKLEECKMGGITKNIAIGVLIETLNKKLSKLR